MKKILLFFAFNMFINAQAMQHHKDSEFLNDESSKELKKYVNMEYGGLKQLAARKFVKDFLNNARSRNLFSNFNAFEQDLNNKTRKLPSELKKIIAEILYNNLLEEKNYKKCFFINEREILQNLNVFNSYDESHLLNFTIFCMFLFNPSNVIKKKEKEWHSGTLAIQEQCINIFSSNLFKNLPKRIKNVIKSMIENDYLYKDILLLSSQNNWALKHSFLIELGIGYLVNFGSHFLTKQILQNYLTTHRIGSILLLNAATYYALIKMDFFTFKDKLNFNRDSDKHSRLIDRVIGYTIGSFAQNPCTSSTIKILQIPIMGTILSFFI